jgi:hypothetical protein
VVCAKCINGCSYFSGWQLNLREQPEENSVLSEDLQKMHHATFLARHTNHHDCKNPFPQMTIKRKGFLRNCSSVPEQEQQLQVASLVPKSQGQPEGFDHIIKFLITLISCGHQQ